MYTKSEKGKTPWITVNGVNVADSQFAIDYLKKELGVDNNSMFSDRDKGIFKIITDWRDYDCYLDKIVDHLPNFT